jgi:hypothetical protein
MGGRPRATFCDFAADSKNKTRSEKNKTRSEKNITRSEKNKIRSEKNKTSAARCHHTTARPCSMAAPDDDSDSSVSVHCAYDTLFDHPACASFTVFEGSADADKGHQSLEGADPHAGAESSSSWLVEWTGAVDSGRRGSERADKRGSYKRLDGKGLRKGWADKAAAHLAVTAPGGAFFSSSPCEELPRLTALRTCPTGKRCLEHVRLRDIQECLMLTYGDPKLDEGRKPADAWPSVGNHPAGALFLAP